MAKRVGGLNYEGRYFIVRVADDWKMSDPLPPPSQDDLWFDRLPDFVAALGGPWNHQRINRQPWRREQTLPSKLPVAKR
jgi:hypothetical protein